MLRTPNGTHAGTIDRIMLLAMWAKHLNSNQQYKHFTNVIFVGMGKPTFPINDYATQTAMNYWAALWTKSQRARHQLNQFACSESKRSEINDEIANSNSVSDYGLPQGELEARQKMAVALNNWYTGIKFEPDNILFTVGGAGALRNVFAVINDLYPNCRIITPFPHYSLYAGPNKENRLHPINVMQLPGYRLTAKALEQSIQEAINLGKQDGGMPRAFILCDPSNPLGTVITEQEAKEITTVLRNYPDLWIILDEAYAEMCLNDQLHASLLYIAPDLKNRIILLRSATKALSAAGERMAIAVTFNPEMMTKLVKENTNTCGHGPKSLQFAFAEAMNRFDSTEQKNLVAFYRPQVESVQHGLANIGASMPDQRYHTQGTFYVLADLSDLIGSPLPEETFQVLGKRGLIETDEDIAYSLLLEDGIMIAPLSYFGCDPKQGYLRITCSGGRTVLNNLISRLNERLTQTRMVKREILIDGINRILNKLKEIDLAKSNEITNKLYQLISRMKNPAINHAEHLKKVNTQLEKMLEFVSLYFKQRDMLSQTQAAITLQSHFRGMRGRKSAKKWQAEIDKQWYNFSSNFDVPTKIKKEILNTSPSERLEYSGWRLFLKQNYGKADKNEENILRAKL